ncbi:adhesion G protein-coupled receptor E3-like isoform X3 [Chiloscyllium plagiosum]|uniref:adhesion G protein-coupled receptor E3-like isoform X3 n=1 Tax=Chiloscyllium plagiosum TaxID=36176 RepID=UPI001CB83278|nr:adhesion G protein-coupled receptor E3-like isoform X3 [Chiloscyllium plagiosum]
MERGWYGQGLTLYLGSLAILSLVTTQPCPQEDNLNRNPDCIDSNCNTDVSPLYRDCGENMECYVAQFMLFVRNHCICEDGFEFTPSDQKTDCFDGDCHMDEPSFYGDCGEDVQCYIAQFKLFSRNHCVCKTGFMSTADETTSDQKTDCFNIDDCVDKNSDELCGPNGTCLNTVGSYNCSRNQTFETAGVTDSFNLTKDQHQAPVVSPKLPTDPNGNNVSAVGAAGIDPSLSTASEQPASPVELFCSRMTNTSRLFGELCQNPANGSLIEDITSLTTLLFAEDSLLKAKAQEERLNSASQVLQDVERAAIMLALNSKGQELKDVTNKAMDLQLRVIDMNSMDDKVSLEAKGNTIDISWKPATSSEITGSVAVAFIVYHNMGSILRGASYKNKETSQKYEDVQLQSRVISAAVGSSGNYKLSVAVSFSLKHKEDTSVGRRRLCAYWMHTTNGGHWSPSGCELVGSNDTHTTCQCDHLSSFAILMAFSEELQEYSIKPLTVITFIGILISLACLALAIGTFVFCSQAQNAVTATHTQLCISLFLAELLFIMGIDKTGNQKLCGIVAGCLHYLFLTAFAWMSLETLQLHLMVRNLKNMRVFHSSNIGRYIYPLGYGPPALIVAISAATCPNGYGSHRNCWLLVENGFIWSFLGPVYLIILMNTFLFTITVCILNEELSNRDVNVSKIKDTRMLTFKAIGQIFILGCTWILGLFHFQEETIVMAYLFTIVNSFQGTFIFIILCVLNPKIRAEYSKWITCICKTRKSLLELESVKVPLSVTSEIV